MNIEYTHRFKISKYIKKSIFDLYLFHSLTGSLEVESRQVFFYIRGKFQKFSSQ